MDTGIASPSALDPALDAVLATIQLEQRVLARRYCAVVALRRAASDMRVEGLFPSIRVEGERLVLEVAVLGLGGFDHPVALTCVSSIEPGVTAQSDEDAPGDQWLDAAQVAAPATVEQKSEPVSETAAVPDVSTGQSVASVSDVCPPVLASDAESGGGEASAPVAAAAGPVETALAAAARSARRGGGWKDAWSAEDDARLVQLTAQNVRGGMGKVAAAGAAACAMGRSFKAGESRIFNRLKSTLDAELEARGGATVAPARVAENRAKPRKIVDREISPGWTPDEDRAFVTLVADGMCAGVPKGKAIATAAAKVGRPESGCGYRILHQLKAPLQAELDRRLAAETGKAPPAAAQRSPEPVPAPQPAPVPEAAAAAPEAPVSEAEPLVVQPVSQHVAAPALVAPKGPRPEGLQTQVAKPAPAELAPVIAHIKALTKGDPIKLRRDFAIIHLACANWTMATIAADLGMDARTVKERFEALCHYDPVAKKGRYPRSHVYHALEHILAPQPVEA